MTTEQIRADKLNLGKGIAEDIAIEFKANQGGSNKKIKYNQVSSSLQFGDDDLGFQDFGSGSGGQSNYFQNGDFEINDEGATVGTSGGVAPTLSGETSTPLIGERSCKVTWGAGTGYADFAINPPDNAVVDGRIQCSFRAYIKTDASSLDNDIEAGIYNVTDAKYVGSIPSMGLKGDYINVIEGLMDFASGKTYVLRVRSVVATAGNPTLVDKLLLTPDSVSSLQKFERRTNWVGTSIVSVSNSNGGSVDTALTRFRVNLDGVDTPQLEYEIIVTAASSSTTHTLTLGLGGATFVGTVAGSQAGAGTGEAKTNAGAATISQGTGVATTSVRVTGAAALNIIPNWFNDNLDQQKLHLVTPGLLKSNAKCRYKVVDTAVTGGNILPFSVEDFNVAGFVNDGSGSITVPTDGYYRFHCMANLVGPSAATGTLTTTGSGGAKLAALAAFNGTESPQTLMMYATAYLLAGDVIAVTLANADITGIGDTQSQVNIERMPDNGSYNLGAFGIASPQVAGLLPPASAMSRELATMMGQYEYVHSLPYKDGITPTLTPSSGSITNALTSMVPRQMSDGTWRLKVTFALNLSVSLSTGWVSINGVTGVTSFNQAGTAHIGGAAADGHGTAFLAPGGAFTWFLPGASASPVHTLTSNNPLLAFDVKIGAKPTWAY